MCEMCEGRSADEFIEGVIDDIRQVGWAVIAVEDEQGRHLHTYTAGLTRYHGHPELIFSGADFPTAHHVLDVLADGVREGRRFEPGQLLASDEVGRSCLMVRVDGGRLPLAQALYGSPVTTIDALQVVWSDEGGRWPWEMCDHHRDGQQLYGVVWPPGSSVTP